MHSLDCVKGLVVLFLDFVKVWLVHFPECVNGLVGAFLRPPVMGLLSLPFPRCQLHMAQDGPGIAPIPLLRECSVEGMESEMNSSDTACLRGVGPLFTHMSKGSWALSEQVGRVEGPLSTLPMLELFYKLPLLEKTLVLELWHCLKPTASTPSFFVLGAHLAVLRGYSQVCITGRLKETYGMPGIEPGSAICRTNAFRTALASPSTSFFLHGLLSGPFPGS